MGGFDDILDGFDDIVEPEKPERPKLKVSEAEAKTGTWNAQDDGNVWTSDGGPRAWTTRDDKDCSDGHSHDHTWNANTGQNPRPTIGPMSSDPLSQRTDDRVAEDEVLDDFLEDDEDDYEDGECEGGMFDDLF